jgi:hypothetical protein
VLDCDKGPFDFLAVEIGAVGYLFLELRAVGLVAAVWRHALLVHAIKALLRLYEGSIKALLNLC